MEEMSANHLRMIERDVRLNKTAVTEPDVHHQLNATIHSLHTIIYWTEETSLLVYYMVRKIMFQTELYRETS